MSLPHDLKDYRAPRWHDAIAEHAPELLISLAILALLLDRFGVWA